MDFYKWFSPIFANPNTTHSFQSEVVNLPKAHWSLWIYGMLLTMIGSSCDPELIFGKVRAARLQPERGHGADRGGRLCSFSAACIWIFRCQRWDKKKRSALGMLTHRRVLFWELQTSLYHLLETQVKLEEFLVKLISASIQIWAIFGICKFFQHFLLLSMLWTPPSLNLITSSSNYKLQTSNLKALSTHCTS